MRSPSGSLSVNKTDAFLHVLKYLGRRQARTWLCNQGDFIMGEESINYPQWGFVPREGGIEMSLCSSIDRRLAALSQNSII